MNVLIIGSGGRESALAWKLSKSPIVTKIYIAPGNGGTLEYGENVDIKVNDIEGLKNFALNNDIDYTVVGSEEPLALGIVDEFKGVGLKAFGPDKKAAAVEYSKVFAKEFAFKYNIPTARYEVFDNAQSALLSVKNRKHPVVIKADGLAMGKGVVICNNLLESEDAIKDIMVENIFGDAGKKLIIEEYLTGTEISGLCFVDGEVIVPMISAKDHKNIFDGDSGPNTGGMGAIAPNPLYTDEVAEECMSKIFIPTVKALVKEGRPFKGVLYFGLMLTAQGPKLIEYNSRFGDPEAQVILPMLETDLMEIIMAVIDGRLSEISVKWKAGAGVCVVLASGGYPLAYRTGMEINGLDKADGFGCIPFHAGTELRDGKLYTKSGRVIGVTALGPDLESAVSKAYAAVSEISFNNKYYRRDIGKI